MRPDKNSIEGRLKESIDAFVQDARPMGHFLTAILSNDLDNLPHIVAYLYNDCPSLCWGTPTRTEKWNGTSARVRP